MKANFNKPNCLLIFVTLLYSLKAEISPLTLQPYDISLILDGSTSNTYAIKIKAKITDNFDITVCFKQLQIQTNTQQNSCSLQFSNEAYKCVRLYPSVVPNLLWKSFNFTFGQNLTQTNESISINSNNLQQMAIMTDFLLQGKVYHIISASSLNNLNAGIWKQAYCHTYATYSYADTLITQRNSYCAYYNDKVSLIFQGGVLRQGQKVFFVGILTIDVNQEGFSMWGGYSFSSDHAGRDMIGFESVNGQVYDLYSIYASAPFLDTQSNIKGSSDVTQICDSSTGDSSLNLNYFYFTQFYRPYDTLDLNGDQKIRQKINNKHCFAAYFTTDNTEQPSPYSKNFQHQLIDCHLPNLGIFGQNLKFCAILILIYFVIL